MGPPKAGKLNNIVRLVIIKKKNRNIPTLGLIFLLHSYLILGGSLPEPSSPVWGPQLSPVIAGRTPCEAIEDASGAEVRRFSAASKISPRVGLGCRV